MKKETVVIYDAWQYDCCGTPFEVGDNISWSATPCGAKGYKYLLKEGDKDLKYDYTYEGCAGGFGTLTGKVKSIKALDEIFETVSEIRHVVLGYEIKDGYNSTNEISKTIGSSNMLVVLEDVEYEFDSPLKIARLHPTVLVHDVSKELGISIAKKFKNNNYNVILSSDNEKILNNTNEEISKYGKYTKTQLINDLYKNKHKYLYNFSELSHISVFIHIAINEKDNNDIKEFIELSRIEKNYQRFYIVRKRENDTLIEFNDILPCKESDVIIKDDYYLVNSLDNDIISKALIDFISGDYKF